jgi:hypothetical protein
MKLRRLVYTSQTEMFFSKHDLLNLLYQSRACNSIAGITGILIHRSNFFLQVIEGEPEAIGDLLGKLIKDTRHIKLKIV